MSLQHKGNEMIELTHQDSESAESAETAIINACEQSGVDPYGREPWCWNVTGDGVIILSLDAPSALQDALWFLDWRRP